MAIDLGQIVTTLGSEYIQAKYAPRPKLQPALSFDPLSPLNLFNSGDPVMDDAVGLSWKPKRRRRRRRLATLSDIRDLAALKSVLGNGEAFKTWIATHPS